MPLLPEAKNCDISVKKNFRRISKKLGYTASPPFASINLTDLLASRLIATNSGKVLESIADLTAWIAGTANQVIVTDDNDGTLTLSTPQDTHKDAEPEFAGWVIKDADNYIVAFMDNTEFYITLHAPVSIEIGNPIGLLLALTYAEEL